MTRLQTLFKPEQISLRAKLIRNVCFCGARLVLLAPLPLLVIPFFIKKLGTSGYGTWAVFLAISGVTSLADLGLVTTLSKHVAEFYTLKDFRALSRLLNTGFVLYLAIATVLVLILSIGASSLIAMLFRSSLVSSTELHLLWRYLMCLVFANILTLLFSSVAVGLQRMDLSTSLASLNLLLATGLSVLLLSLGWGLQGILAAYVLAAWAALCCYVYVLHRLLPEIRPDLLDCRWSMAKEIFAFSVKTYVTQVVVVVHNQIEKLYLAWFVGVISVGWYDISSDLALKVRAIPNLVLSPMMPAASELDALNDQKRLEDLYYRTHKYLAFIGVPLTIYVVFISKKFVELWLGPALSVIALPFSVLVVTNFINLTTGPGLLVLVAKGKLNPGIYSAIVGLVLNVTVSLVLIRSYGFNGAVTGTALSLSIGSIVFLYLFQRETAGAFSAGLKRAYFKPVSSSLAIVSVLSMLTYSDQPSWSGLVTCAVVFAVAYLVSLRLLNFFDNFDLSIAESVLRIPAMTRGTVPDA